MFGLISAGVSLAGLGMSALEAIKANRDMKKSQADANASLNKLAGLTRENVYAGMSGADVSSVQTQAINQQTAQGIQALQGMGPEAAIGGTANMIQGQAASMADVTQKQAIENQKVKELRAGEQSAIEQENLARQEAIIGYKVGAATNAQQQAAAARASAIEGIFGGALGALQYAKQDFDPDTGKYIGTKWGQGQDDSSKMATIEDAKKAGLTEEQISAIQKMFGV